MAQKQSKVTDYFPFAKKNTFTHSLKRKRKQLLSPSTPGSPQLLESAPKRARVESLSSSSSSSSLSSFSSEGPSASASGACPASGSSSSSATSAGPSTGPSSGSGSISNLRLRVGSEEREPVHSKFRHLAETEAEANLVLPAKFKTLVETFRCMDTVVSMLYNRKEMITFNKLKQGVEDMTRRAFNERKLAQLVSVYPEAYRLRYEKGTPAMNEMSSTSKNDYFLVICPPFGAPVMLPSYILGRKRKLTQKLLDIVKEHHQKYLQALDPPVHVENEQLKRWHPRFKLNETPDIVPDLNALPTHPGKSQINHSVESFLETSRLKLGMESPNKKDSRDVASISSPKIVKGALKGLSTALLDKIRAKEALNLAKEMTRSVEDEKKLGMMKRLPEFVRILQNYFVGEKRAAIPVEMVVKKVRESYHTCLSGVEVHEHVKLLKDLLPDWLYLLDVRKDTFVKLDRTKSTHDLINRIEKKAEILQRN